MTITLVESQAITVSINVVSSQRTLDSVQLKIKRLLWKWVKLATILKGKKIWGFNLSKSLTLTSPSRVNRLIVSLPWALSLLEWGDLPCTSQAEQAIYFWGSVKEFHREAHVFPTHFTNLHQEIYFLNILHSSSHLWEENKRCHIYSLAITCGEFQGQSTVSGVSLVRGQHWRQGASFGRGGRLGSGHRWVQIVWGRVSRKLF